MKVGIIGEGETEFACLPNMAAQLGHVVVGCHSLGGVGSNYPLDALFTKKIFPYVRGFAVKNANSRPDKVIIVFDREDRAECCGSLANMGLSLLQQQLSEHNLQMPLAVVIPNRLFECWLLANTTVLDNSPIMQRPISLELGNVVDEISVSSVIRRNLRPGHSWDKPKYGKALVQRLDLRDPRVLQASRSLRKFVKELPPAH